MTTPSPDKPILSYKSTETTPRLPLFRYFISGVILGIILELGAMIGGIMIVRLLVVPFSHEALILTLVFLIPPCLVFFWAIYKFFQERWLGFLVGTSLITGLIATLALLIMTGRVF